MMLQSARLSAFERLASIVPCHVGLRRARAGSTVLSNGANRETKTRLCGLVGLFETGEKRHLVASKKDVPQTACTLVVVKAE